MIGAYAAFTVQLYSGSFFLGLVGSLIATALFGCLVERLLIGRLYARSYLDQVLFCFGLILFLNEMVRMIWGSAPLRASVPPPFQGAVEILPGLEYPAFRLLVIAVGVVVAVGLYVLVVRTRLGMLIRAGASDRMMIGALGINIRRLFTIVFGLGAALAALAGTMAGPLFSVQIGMGEGILIEALVVIVIGGVGSVRGAAVAALLVGIIDTSGRVLFPPAIAQVTIYVLMAAVLFWRPRGLFPAHG
jgi:branched-chain amino acid transport system permease protein